MTVVRRYTPGMNPACIRIVSIAALLALSLLAGCGNKGPLVLAPAPAAAVPALDSPPATEPTDSEKPSEIPPPPAEDPASGMPPTVPSGPDHDGDG